jgi:beta-N-acetylhexosaminidase
MPMAMTAHVIYSAIDALHPATTSPAVIEDIIRGEMGFDGLLMSDDVSMQALSGDFRDRTDAIFAAGCDVVLHCNGVMDEMRLVAGQTPVLMDKAEMRAQMALLKRERPDSMGESAARQEFASLTGKSVEAV